ncbi:hypothetical protein B0H10DRAFT_2012907 [Mycena sp. CBHHK59/15]|nr:hypothetical protein B0H10DRAFT_2012907 [Mycena sp. CBHHK59/15]
MDDSAAATGKTSATESSSGRLTLAYPSNEKDGKTRYAVVPFPGSYQAAVTASLKVLGKYMTDAREDNILLRYSTKNREGARRIPKFLHGPVYLVVGEKKGSKTKWSEIDKREPAMMDRPESFAGAIEMSKKCMTDNDLVQHPMFGLPVAPEIIADKTLTFCMFVNGMHE